MSFQDLEAGLQPSRRTPLGGPQSPQDVAFLQLQSSLSLQVFKINANVQGMLKLVDQVRILVLPLLCFIENTDRILGLFKLGTGRDTGAVRKGLCVDEVPSGQGNANNLCPLFVDMTLPRLLVIWRSEGPTTLRSSPPFKRS